MEFKVMVIFRLSDGSHGGWVLTSQLLEFSTRQAAEAALTAVRKRHQSDVDRGVIEFIRFYEV